ncbi:molecular chaperone DnaJ [Candidatus Sumerlaeota bacterium]|nr:molecular chaperone DnaJ [Candidatus Sumerlaeota bacterium]
MSKRDYYEILGVSRDADINAIKKAYRQLALKYHPDRNPNNKESEEQFKEACEAYEILTNPEKRSLYDQYGHEGVRGAFSRGGFTWNDFTHFGDFDDIFGDFLGSFFNMGRNSRREVNRGRDLRIHYTLTLEEAFTGKVDDISLKRPEPCPECKGTGASKGSEIKTCSRCGGRGQIRVIQGFFSLTTTCDRCGGTGKIIENPCKACHGEGRILQKVDLKIKIPKGIDNGMEIVIRGEGEAGYKKGPHGDLHVLITVEDHPFFKRQNDDIYCEIPIGFTQAALGEEIEIPSLHGRAKLKIHSGTQTHHIFRIKGHGMPRNETAFGDMLVQVILKTPKKLTPRQKELLQEFASLSSEKPSEEEKGFFRKFKDSINEMTRDIFD